MLRVLGGHLGRTRKEPQNFVKWILNLQQQNQLCFPYPLSNNIYSMYLLLDIPSASILELERGFSPLSGQSSFEPSFKISGICSGREQIHSADMCHLPPSVVKGLKNVSCSEPCKCPVPLLGPSHHPTLQQLTANAGAGLCPHPIPRAHSDQGVPH